MEINITKINLNPNAGGGGNSGGDAKIKLPNGICLSGSEWASSFDMGNHDWSGIRDWKNMFSNCKWLTKLNNMPHNIVATSMQKMFYSCGDLKSVDLSGWDISEVTDMTEMFYGCNDLQTVNFSGWDTSNVTTMRNMFQYCRNLTSIDVTGWDTIEVTDMANMFQSCSKLTSVDLRGWDFSKKPSVSGMFKDCYELKELWIDGDLSYVTALTAQSGFLPGLTNSGHRGTFHYNPQYDISVIKSNSSGWDFVPIE